MSLSIYTDGGSRGNPGRAACSFIIKSSRNIVRTSGRLLGITTNNVAEYSGLILALQELVSLFPSFHPQPKSVVCFSDSELMVKQLNGLYRLKNKKLVPLFSEVKKLESLLPTKIFYKHVPREENKEADALVNKLLTAGPSLA